MWCVCSVKAVWSTPERFSGEFLTMGRYTNVCFLMSNLQSPRSCIAILYSCWNQFRYTLCCVSYVISSLELLVTDDYVIIYFHGAAPRNTMPSFRWLRHCYGMIDLPVHIIIIVIINIIIKCIYIAQGRTILQMRRVGSCALKSDFFSLFLNMSSKCPVLAVQQEDCSRPEDLKQRSYGR